MGTPLSGKDPASSFSGLLQMPPTGVTTSSQFICDGAGNDLPIKASSTYVDIVSGFKMGGLSVSSSATEINKLNRWMSDGYVQPSKAVIANNVGNIFASGTISCSGGGEIHFPKIKDLRSNFVDHGIILTSGNASFREGNYQKFVPIGDITIGFSNAPTSGTLDKMTLLIKQDSTGNRLVTWPGSVSWVGGSPPNLSSDPYRTDIIEVLTFDGGISYHAWME